MREGVARLKAWSLDHSEIGHGGMKAFRPIITGTNGMVSSGHYLSSLAGVQVLQAGGNAIDVGAAAVVGTVLQSDMTSFGGVASIHMSAVRPGLVLLHRGGGSLARPGQPGAFPRQLRRPHSQRRAKRRGPRRPTLDDLLRHLEYIGDMVGIDHVGVGTDMITIEGIHEKIFGVEFNGVVTNFHGGIPARHRFVEGCASFAEIGNMTDRLLRRAHKEDNVLKVMGGNFMLVFKTV